MAAKNHYTIISGTGRAGTTLLMRILGRAGMNIGFDMNNLPIDQIAHAGLELDLRDKPDCDIVKSPHIASYIEEAFDDKEIAIDRAIICMRPLFDVAESRRKVQKLNSTDAEVAGGLTYTSDPELQESVLAQMFFNLLFHLSKNEVPIIFLHYPRFALNSAYFLSMIAPIFRINPDILERAFYAEVNPELIGGPTERERIESLSDNDLIREIGFCDTDGGEILGEKLAAQVVRRRTVYGRKL